MSKIYVIDVCDAHTGEVLSRFATPTELEAVAAATSLCASVESINVKVYECRLHPTSAKGAN